MEKVQVAPSLIAIMILACSPGEESEARAEPMFMVLQSENRVEVHAQAHEGCREATSIPSRNSCENFAWAVLGVESALITDLCRPEPTCVTSVRLERAGEVIAESLAASVAFTTTLGSNTELVIDGCGDPLVVQLPDPLVESDPGIEVSVTEDGVLVSTIESSDELFVRLVGRPSYPREFIAGCRSDENNVLLPTSPDFPAYTAEVFIMGGADPNQDPRVRLHQAQRVVLPVGPSSETDLAWSVAATAARQSPHHETCSEFCANYAAGCKTSDNPDPCIVTCVGSFSVSSGCESEYQAYLDCSSVKGCADAVVTELAESPSQRSTSSEHACSEASRDFAMCME